MCVESVGGGLLDDFLTSPAKADSGPDYSDNTCNVVGGKYRNINSHHN